MSQVKLNKYSREELFQLALAKDTSEELLLELIKDPDWALRFRVSNRQKVPLSILKILAHDEDSDVRSSVASNPNTPLEWILHMRVETDLQRDWMFVEERFATEAEKQLYLELRKTFKGTLEELLKVIYVTLKPSS